MQSVSPSSYRDNVDRQCEAEGDAIDRLADLLDEPRPEPRLAVAMAQARTAIERGLPDVERHPFAKRAATDAWLAIVAEFATDTGWRHRVWRGDFRPIWQRDESTLRRAARIIRRENRRQLLARLQSMPSSRRIDLQTAAKLLDVAERTLQRSCAIGKLPAQRQHGPGRPSYIVRIGDLQRLLADKLGGRAVAA